MYARIPSLSDCFKFTVTIIGMLNVATTKAIFKILLSDEGGVWLLMFGANGNCLFKFV